MITIAYDDLLGILKSKLIKYDFDEDRAEQCASIFAVNNLFGVASHGTNRFESFIKLIQLGLIDVRAIPTVVNSFGSIEQLDGNSGPGPLNALTSTNRSIELAEKNGIGCVAIKNTNHWMRAGYYGWQAAEKGFIFIAFTNAYPLMPPWGAKNPTIGNNPICIAVPRNNNHVVLDMAMSQFSYGQLDNYNRENKELPFYGGYDSMGRLSKNPGEIYKTQRALPIGFWKGSGLAIMIDLITTILSGGKATHQLKVGEHDTGMSQVYIAIDPNKFESADYIEKVADEIIFSIQNAEPAGAADSIIYPGQRALAKKKSCLDSGIPVDEIIWDRIQKI